MNKNIIEKAPLISLVGPPNSGKTSLFNHLSGKNLKTVNYPGSTVFFSSSEVNVHGELINLLDSPGIISLIPDSPDEQVAIDALYAHPMFGKPDLLVVTIDANQLSRHLFLVRQLTIAGFDVIAAITMNDILERNGYTIDTHSLELELGCTVCKIDGRTGKGLDILRNKLKDKLDTASANNDYKRNNGSGDTDELISIYREIGNIEERVLLKLSEVNRNVRTANEALNILNIGSSGSETRTIDKLTLRIDRIILHPQWGLLIFFITMAVLFTSIFWLALPLMDLIDEIFSELAIISTGIFQHSWLGDLISDGIINGVGSVLVFLPQIIILFLLLGFLEDVGYLARGAMLVDKPLSKIGLNGKSFVPMLSGFACAIPAIMAARTIPNRRERLLTIFILPLMSCSARLPVFALLIAFLIPAGNAWIGGLILASIYMFSILSSSAVAGIISKFSNQFVGVMDSSSFILELPTYKVPKIKIIIKSTLQSSYSYISKAGPVILTFSVVLWFLTYFPNTDPRIDEDGLTVQQIQEIKSAERVATSYASELGKILQPVMEPIGLDWRVGVSLISAFAAREVFVSSLALIFKVTAGDDDAMQESLISAMRNAKIENTDRNVFTTSSVIGLIIFFVFALQCLSTVAVSKQETGSWRIPAVQLILFSILAYSLSFVTVNLLRVIGIA
ncbi:MAG: ferrous iron transport protein B [Melioribacteraceae bacterium]|nr:ferrous iron transport protein B [Melioribacteraceae bacterium]